jgi:hypothetical protein
VRSRSGGSCPLRCARSWRGGGRGSHQREEDSCMHGPVPTDAEAFSRGSWRARTRRAVRLRPGWLTAMVAEAQDQLRRGLVLLDPREPCQRRPPRMALPSPSTCPSPSSPPTLQHIERADLTDIERVLVLYRQAVQQRLIGSSEAERLTFVALAQHVLSCRAQNEGGLFRHLLKQKRYQCVTQADEDAALRRLKQHRYGRG